MERLNKSYLPFKSLFPNLKQKKVSFLLDSETFLSNKREAKRLNKRSLIEPYVWSVGAGLEVDGVLYLNFFKTYRQFLDTLDSLNGYTTDIEFVHFNGDKFDHHFLKTALEEKMGVNSQSLLIRGENAKDTKRRNNKYAKKKSQLKQRNFILETRVKAKTYLELTGKINGKKFNTVDMVPKYQNKLDNLSKKLHDMNILPAKYMKSYMKYNKYDRESLVLNVDQYIDWIHKFLSKSEKTYIENDIIVMYYIRKHYNDIFPGFDYNARTLTVNISNAYTEGHPLARFQMLKKFKDCENNEVHLDDSKYMINEEETVYEYVKHFYRGGLNFYNEIYLEKIVKNAFSIDINSSYPYQMYTLKVPTKLISYKENVHLNIVGKKDPNFAQLIELNYREYNRILSNLNSRVLQQMHTKYYRSTNGQIYITDIILHSLVRFIGDFEVFADSVATYKAEYFGARDVIAEFYKVKSTASVGARQNKHLVMYDPMTYEIQDKPPLRHYEENEVQHAKLNLNGLYGIPALREAFNTFQYDENHELETIEAGLKNQTRSLVFAVYVTAGAFAKLIEPLTYLTGKEIDKNFVYADTDSLYLKKAIMHKIPKSLFDPIALGSWDIENKQIDEIYVQNHKKYCYQTPKKWKVRAGGVSQTLVNKHIETETMHEFIKNHFHAGASIDTIRSFICENGHVAIVNTDMKLSPASKYPKLTNPEDILGYNLEVEKFRDLVNSTGEEYLYMESKYGSIGQTDIVKHTRPNAIYSLDDYLALQDEILNEIGA